MTKTKSSIVQIVTLASSLAERLSNESFWVNTEGIDEQQTIDDRMAYWCQVVAQNNWETFHKRLSWDGLNIELVRRVSGSAYLDEDCSLPKWAETLSEIIETGKEFSLHSNATDSDRLPIDREKPLPNEKDLAQQVATIQSAFYAKIAHKTSNEQTKAAKIVSAINADLSNKRNNH